MATRALTQRSPRPTTFVVLATLGAAAVGVLSAINPVLAAAGAGAMIAFPAAILRPKLIASLLVVAIFAEIVTIGGITIGRLAVPLGLIAAVASYFAAPVRLRESGVVFGAILAYSALAVASLAWTVSVSYTAISLGSLGLAAVTTASFAILMREPEDVRRLLWVVTGSALLLGLWWIASYAKGVDRFENQAGDPNILAAFQVVAIPMILVLAMNAKSFGGRLALYVVCGLVAGSIVSTLSRGGVVTLLITLAIIAVVPARALFGTRVRKAAFYSVAGFGLAVFLILAGGSLNDRVQAAQQQGTLIGSRSDLWKAAEFGYREHPVGGLGFGAFKAVSFSLLSRTPDVNLAYHDKFSLRSGEYVHNAFLGSLTELGPLGLVLFLGLYAATGRSLVRTARRAGAAGDAFIRSMATALFVSLVAFGVASLSLSSETSRALWMIFGVSLALPGMIRGEEDRGTAGSLGPSVPQEDAPASS